jgi:hypothetical protein
MNRRSLDFHSFDEVIADLDRLQTGYEKGGNWSLGQICNHIGIFVRGSMDGFTTPRPPLFVRLIGPLLVRRMLKKRSMPEGIKLPSHFLPKDASDDAREIQALKDLLRRFDQHRGPVHRSPLAKMTYEKWRDLHLIHCAHHLSFLRPAAKA